MHQLFSGIVDHLSLNPNVDSPLFAVSVAAALYHYQVDPVHQPWGLSTVVSHYYDV